MAQARHDSFRETVNKHWHVCCGIEFYTPLGHTISSTSMHHACINNIFPLNSVRCLCTSVSTISSGVNIFISKGVI